MMRLASACCILWFAIALLLPVLGFRCAMQREADARAAAGMPARDMAGMEHCGSRRSGDDHSRSHGTRGHQCDCTGCCCVASVAFVAPTWRAPLPHTQILAVERIVTSMSSRPVGRGAAVLPLPTGPPAAIRLTA